MQELGDKARGRLAENLEGLRDRITAAARRSGREGRDVRLVAVTKRRSLAEIHALLDLGVDAVGENRPEEVLRKQAETERSIPWHMIGHFQRKKIPKVLPFLSMVHSVHGAELLETLDRRRSAELGAPSLPVLLQVNVSGEEAKQGFEAEEIPGILEHAEGLAGVEVRGLMTMAPHTDDESTLRGVFGGLRQLAEKLGRKRLPELSMGMSGDFEIAIEEGATLVRVGSALFDGMEVLS